MPNKIIKPQLTITHGGDKRCIHLGIGRTTIGRRSDNTVVISDLTVSGHHAAIIISDEGSVIEDLGSKNGTYIDGTRIDMPHKLENGMQIMVGLCRLTFGTDDDELQKQVQFKDNAAIAQGGTAVQGFQSTLTAMPAYLEFIKGSSFGTNRLELDKTVNPIGNLGIGVAALAYGKRGWTLSHVDGEAPQINGVRVTSSPVKLKSGDVITIGDMQARFVVG